MDLRPGDALDFWRVEAFEPNGFLRLRAEMKLPGRAWLQFEAEPDNGGTILTQTAVFDPTGLAGLGVLLSEAARGEGPIQLIWQPDKNAIGVLKGYVNQWLRDLEPVQAFHSAQPQHGGTGAVYVLLSRKFRNNP